MSNKEEKLKEIKDYICKDSEPEYNATYGWQRYLGDSAYSFGYIYSYKEAADDLVEMCVPDLYIFPIMFCYRQYMELVLKNICECGMNEEEYKAFIRDVSHRLDKIWEYAKPFLIENLGEEHLGFIEQCVMFFNELDPNSFNFRYERDKKMERSIKENYLTINTLKLKKCIDLVDSYLRYTYDYTG